MPCTYTYTQEKGRVLRLAVSLLGKAAGKESILPAGFTNRCRSLVPLGAGTTAGVKGRPIFTRPAAVWHHLRRMQQYSAEMGPAAAGKGGATAGQTPTSTGREG